MARPTSRTILALTALAAAQAAQAHEQKPCVDAADLGDTISYALPLVYDGLEERCSAQFPANPYMQSRGAAFMDRFRASQDAYWPGALRVLKVCMARPDRGERDADTKTAEMIAALPEEALRPFIDSIIEQMVATRVIPDVDLQTCDDVAEAMKLLEPLPPENFAGLVSLIARQADLKNPEICAGDPVRE